LLVDFENTVITGSNTLDVKALKDGVSQLVLDTQGLTISKVEQKVSDTEFKELTFSYQQGSILGSIVNIVLNA
jgi:hypothetical protein